MKNSILIIAMLFAFSFCNAQTKLTFEPLQEAAPPKAITDITYYKTSWADCMMKAHIACWETWWCPALEPVYYTGWAMGCTINPDQVWNKVNIQPKEITIGK